VVYDTYYSNGVFFIGAQAVSPGTVVTTAAGSTASSWSRAGSVYTTSSTVPYVTGASSSSTTSIASFYVGYNLIPQTALVGYTQPELGGSFPNSGTPLSSYPTTGYSVDSTTSSSVVSGLVTYYSSTTATASMPTTYISTQLAQIEGGFTTVALPFESSVTRSVIAEILVNTGDTNSTRQETRVTPIADRPYYESTFYACTEGPTPLGGYSYPQSRMALFTDSGTSAGATLSASPSVSGIPVSQFGQSGRYAPVIEPPATGLTTGTGTPVTFVTGGATTTFWNQSGAAAGQAYRAGLAAGIYRTAVGSSTGTSLYSLTILSSSANDVTQFNPAPCAVPLGGIFALPAQELAPMPIQPPLSPAVFTWSVTPGY
jgi:hypothetical protein